MPRVSRIAVLVLVAALACAAPAPARARASSAAERGAAARALAHRTLSFDRQRRAAYPRARAALGTRRHAAQACLALWNGAPLARRGDLGVIYFEYLSGALWSVDGSIFHAWTRDLTLSPNVRRSPVLGRAADALGRDYTFAQDVYRAFPDACATLTAWHTAGWSDAARPAALAKLDGLSADATRPATLGAAAAQVVRYAPSEGKAAAKIVRVGVDEPDVRVNAHHGCDPVGALVLPDEYPPCPAVKAAP